VLLGIDHLIIATPDLDEAVDRLRAELGIEAGGGGIHPGLGTANRLAWFGDTYLELVDATDRELAAASWLGGPSVRLLDERGGGFVGYALCSDDIERDVTTLRAFGSTLAEPVPGERKRSDGSVVHWRLAVPSLVGPTAPPFIIEHDPDSAEWTATDRRTRATQVHPVGGSLRLTGLEISMVDPSRVAAAYRQVVGIALEPWLGDGDWSLAAIIGGQRIVLRPAEPSSEPSVVIRLATTGDRSASAEIFGCRFVIEPIAAA
jgi:catechol 2,3-dioxygenase-like lactoylglutathione lyase family enzyme